MARTIPPIEERFWSRVERGADDECWLWTGAIRGLGYGAFTPAKGQPLYAHRWVYEQYVGPIPPGMVIDHDCHNGTDCPGNAECLHRRCVNPAHLRAVTRGDNTRASHLHPAAHTHCPQGHEFTAENTYYAPGSPDWRLCRTCRTAAQSKRAALQRQERHERGLLKVWNRRTT